MTAKTLRNKIQSWIDTKACIYYLIPGGLHKKTEREKLELKVYALTTFNIRLKRLKKKIVLKGFVFLGGGDL